MTFAGSSRSSITSGRSSRQPSSGSASSSLSRSSRRSEQLIPGYGTIQILRESEPEEWFNKEHVILLEDDFAGLRAETTLFHCPADDDGNSEFACNETSSGAASLFASSGEVKMYSRTKCSLLASEVRLLLDQHFEERRLKGKDREFLDAVFHNRVSQYREEVYHKGWRSLYAYSYIFFSFLPQSSFLH